MMIVTLNKDNHSELKSLFKLFCLFKSEIMNKGLTLDKDQTFILFQEYLSKENVVCYYYTIESKVVGFLVGEIKEKIPIISKPYFFGNIRYIYVDPDYRGKLISTKLKEKYIDYLIENNIFIARIVVSKKNISTHNIYYKWGFKDLSIVLQKNIVYLNK